MTTAYTSLLGLALPVTGELSGTWGDTVNNSITSLLDSAVAGTTNVSTDADVTLTTTTGAANTAREAILLFSGARTALRTITAPAQSKVYTVINATTGGYSVKLVGAGPTTGLTIPNGASAVVAWNGSDFVEVGAGSIGNLTVNGTLTVTGATTLQSTLAVTGNITNTAGTANGVTYLNGSKVLTSGSALTFDGTNLGVGLTPNTWYSTFRAIQIGASGSSIFGRSENNSVAIGSNMYVSAAGSNTYIATNTASYYQQLNGTHAWYYAASGTAGTGITFTQAMTLDASGNLGIGTSSPTQPLTVNGQMLSLASSGASFKNITPTTGNNFMWLGNTGNNFYVGKESSAGGTLFVGSSAYAGVIGNDGAYSLQFATNNNVRATIDSSGNLGVGITPAGWVTFKAVELTGGAIAGIGTNQFDVVQNAYYDGAFKYKTTYGATYYQQTNSTHSWYNAPSGTAGNAITFTQAMTLDASGNLGIGTSSPSYRADVSNGDLRVTRNSGDGFIWIGNQTSSYYISGGTSSNALYFVTNGSERARIDSSGNVSIGTTSANTTLHVQGSTTTDGSIKFNMQAQGTGAYNSSPQSGMMVALQYTSGGAYAGMGGWSIGKENATDGNYASYYAIHTRPNGGSITERARILSSGNLVLGGTTPSTPNAQFTSVAASTNQLSAAFIGTAANNANQYSGIVIGGEPSSAKTGIFLVSAGSAYSLGDLVFSNNTAVDGTTASPTDQRFRINNGGIIQFFNSSNSETARIDNSGSFLLGGPTAFENSASRLQVYQPTVPAAEFSTGGGATTDTVGIWNRAASGDNQFIGFYTDTSATRRGSITYNRGAGVVAYNVTSDYRAKDIYGPIADSGALIDSVPVYMGKMKGATQERPMFIAHETPAYSHTGEKDAVDKDGNPVYQQMDPSALIPVMWAEIQSLRKRLAALEAK